MRYITIKQYEHFLLNKFYFRCMNSKLVNSYYNNSNNREVSKIKIYDNIQFGESVKNDIFKHS